ncbi:electron transfer flavoprotein subunit alpha/FixB family protein [Paraburkholderia sp. BCC1886]|uniref:electron transfer flavoprotein subunit alpha/FixB family protein n=1 Tax=Paraburkholderia sp. BCC1886 TaxID=2562670 RepID=UPI001183559F|nr:FAD-binding protein [Paraburkholderia sp. BCC1886]
MTTLVIAEHDAAGQAPSGGTARLRNSTLNTIAAALQLSNGVHVLVAGSGAQSAAEAARRVAGVDKVIYVDAPHLADGLAENVAAQVLSIANGYTHIFFAATAAGKNTAPRVAAKLDASQISDVIAIESADTFQRPIYAGNAIATVQSADAVKVATIRTTAFEAAVAEAKPDGSIAPIETLPAVGDSGLSTFIRREVATSERPELTGARVVVSGGRGLGSRENFALLDPLAEKLGAALGASRAAVDSGFAPNDWQVGQTGKIVAPDVYLAFGISGAIQHLAGMKDSKVIVAVNKDADAPIFGVADYGLVGDLFEVLPALTQAL